MRAYKDPTADLAIGRVYAEEKRKKKMMERSRANGRSPRFRRGGCHGKNIRAGR